MQAGFAFSVKGGRQATSFRECFDLVALFWMQVFSAPMEQILQRLQAFGEFEVVECSIFFFFRSFGYRMIDLEFTSS